MADDYNPLFDTFVKPGPKRLYGLVAYALYKQSKREWAASKSGKPTDVELASYVETWTPSLISGTNERAERILEEFGNSFVDSARAGIREDAIRGDFRKDVWAAMLGAFFYSIVLLLLVLVLEYFGVDILELAKKLGPPHN